MDYQAELERINTRMTEISVSGDPESHQAEFDGLAQRFDTLLRAAKRERWVDDVKAGLRSGKYKTVAGTMTEAEARALVGDDSRDADRLSGVRSQAMRQLDASVRNGLPASGAEAVEQLIGTGPDVERSWVARWVTLTGDPLYRSSFAKLLLHGEQSAQMQFSGAEREAFTRVAELRAEQRAMSLTDNAGGYLVPYELSPEVVISGDGSVNNLLAISRVINTVSDVWHGVSSAGVQANWYAEAAEVSDDSPVLAEPTVPSHRMSAFVPFSVEVQGDADSLLTEVGKLLQDGALQLLNTALTTGSGSGEPTGLITALVAAGGSVVVPSAGSDAFANADIYALQNALPPRFSGNAQFCAHLATINSARQFETTNGAPAHPGLQQQPPVLLGRNVNELSNMDGVINAGQENYLLVYGSFENMVVTRRVGSTVELVPHIFGAAGRPKAQRGLFLWGRWGSDVLVPQAFRLLNVT